MAARDDSAPNERSISIPGQASDQPAALAGDDKAWKTPQKWLHRFIRTVAFMERTGNAVGTLAFTWATVVVLGGFSTDLRDDFWYATAIVFLEAFRVFSRENRSDDKLLFKTTGGIRVLRLSSTLELLYFLNAVVVILCLSIIILIALSHLLPNKRYTPLLLAGILVPLAKFPVTSLLKRANKPRTRRQARRVGVLLPLIPLAAILALACVLVLDGTPPTTVVATATLLFIMCVLSQQLITAREAIKTAAVADEASPSSVGFARRACRVLRPKLINAALLVFIPCIVFLMMNFGYLGPYTLLTAVALGNFQIPVAVARVAISSARLAGRVNRIVTNNVNLVPSLKIYGLVLAQGALYILACLIDPFSVVLRRWLARRCKLGGVLGVRCVDLYHEHAYDACMEEGLLAMDDVDILSFAINSLISSNEPDREKVLAAVRVLHSLLQSGGSKARLAASKITTSTNTVATLIGMLAWAAIEDHDARLFAAKIIAALAGEIPIVRFPGTVQLISSLLDTRSNPMREQGGGGTTQAQVAAPAGNINTDHCSTCCCCFRKPNNCRIKKLWSLPEDEHPDNDEEALPVLGMVILEKLVSDPENCARIGRATGLISKAIGFIACSSDDDHAIAVSGEAQRCRPITTSSLKLVAKLASTKGEVGVELRRKISDHPFLLSCLSEILEGDSREQYWASAMDIVGKLSVDEDTRQEVGDNRVIIARLVRKFLDQPSSTDGDHPLWASAGKALEVLSMESPSNCSAILKEAENLKKDEEHGHDLVDDLKNMLWSRDDDGHRGVVAASLLQNLCAHVGDDLHRHPGSTEHLASALKEVLEKILDANGKQLEVLIGLASQIHNAIPAQRFEDAVKSFTDNLEALIQKLWAHSTPTGSQTCSDQYKSIFRKKGMVEALTKVERTPSKRYRLFFGDAGVVLERGLPLPELVAKSAAV
uniref:Uncharacterized protein n=1 Tax=Leersia perrieri TaxID=77586 RepID=A0A0D9V2Z0_9ORYZ